MAQRRCAANGFFIDDFRGQDLYQRYGGGYGTGYGDGPVALHLYEWTVLETGDLRRESVDQGVCEPRLLRAFPHRATSLFELSCVKTAVCPQCSRPAQLLQKPRSTLENR
jgi:hypothetical protein